MIHVEDEGFEKLGETVVNYIDAVYPDKTKTFKVNCRRARKNYPMESMEINAALGEILLNAFPELSVDVHAPEILLNVEIREKIYIYSEIIPGPGGMPVGTGGKAMLLLSGGIDSPVAGYMIAKRGVKIDAVYFHAPPYTSERAREKVLELASILAEYAGEVRVHIVSLTHIQEELVKHCNEDYFTLLLRRYMMTIAERVAKYKGCNALVTGESLGQVASQTMQALGVTDSSVKDMPVFRPCIGMDKEEIITISRKMGAFETSIQPYEDCCTVFTPKHPKTKPELQKVIAEENKVDFNALADEAFQSLYTVTVEGKY